MGEGLRPQNWAQNQGHKNMYIWRKSSWNQAETAIGITAEKNIVDYPKAYDIIRNDIYVDDWMPGTHSEDEGLLVTDELKLSLENGGSTLKGFTFSGRQA